MQIWKKTLSGLTSALLLCTGWQYAAHAEEFIPGGSAAQPAIAAYEDWMQFETPDTNTPAIDEDGCLNYALGKMSVRYNLPIPGADALTDSYTYYATFTQTILEPGMPKMQRVAAAYADYLTLGETVWLSGGMEERMEQAYAVCAAKGDGLEWSYILQMTTASGSDHYVLVDRVDLETQRLYLLDSGSWYINYLGDEKSTEKGYFITAVHPYHIQSVPGDLDGDLQLTASDAELLLREKASPETENGDANHDGTVDTGDVVYIAHVAQYDAMETAQCALQSDDISASAPPSEAEPEQATLPAQPSAAGKWNGQIFQKQLERNGQIP